ncbi:hypothetical protein [Bacillus sp. JZ76]
MFTVSLLSLIVALLSLLKKK